MFYMETTFSNGVGELRKGSLLRTVQQSPSAIPTALVRLRVWEGAKGYTGATVNIRFVRSAPVKACTEGKYS